VTSYNFFCFTSLWQGVLTFNHFNLLVSIFMLTSTYFLDTSIQSIKYYLFKSY